MAAFLRVWGLVSIVGSVLGSAFLAFAPMANSLLEGSIVVGLALILFICGVGVGLGLLAIASLVSPRST